LLVEKWLLEKYAFIYFKGSMEFGKEVFPIVGGPATLDKVINLRCPFAHNTTLLRHLKKVHLQI
jgi:glutathionyl-hydroquinone reductase